MPYPRVEITSKDALHRARETGRALLCGTLNRSRPWGTMLLLGVILSTGCSPVSRNSTSHAPRILYVQEAAGDGGEGMSWSTAFAHPQEALDAARDGDQVWVSQGVYGPLGTDGGAVLRMKTGVSVLGGFDGTETDAGQRDPSSAETVLHGEGRSYHVVVGADGALLDGFTVTGGNAGGNVYESQYGGTFSGGGLFNVGVAPVIRNCRFIGNSASFNGGAVFNENSDPLIVDCVFEGNTAYFGGGVDNRSSSPTIINSRFRNNTAFISGGAASNFGGSPAYVNAIFSGNTSGNVGGAILSNASRDVFTNCSFVGNRAGESGGGIGAWEGHLNLTNCILWDNRSGSDEGMSSVGGSVRVLYSIVQGGYAGTGNISEGPQFEQEGFWQSDGSWVEGDYHLSNGSPAVDQGTDVLAPDFDAEYNPRPQALTHDMGAYERRAP